MAELLSPAGGWDSLVAAVQSGADAVYMGFGAYNARRSAKNFTEEEFAQAVRYCHLRGVRVYLTLNTLLTDRELPGAAELLHKASRLGADAVLIQDWGVWQLARQAAPELPLHASTQMSLHTLGGARRAAELGLTRVVLARELSRRDIAAICRDCPAEVEVFAHGALCMCYSGQCALSAVIGGRSGNRGTCAQPCRLPYGVNAPAAGGHPLSLKDANLSPYLQELEDMGVACLKLEGRMKRPEYVAVITSIYRRLLDEKRRPTREEQRQLELAFSRSGFTDGYYLGRKGPQMFGTRPENVPEPKELFAEARTLYEKEDRRTVTVDMDCVCRAGEPVRLTVRAGDQRAEVTGPVPETARNRALTAEELQARLKKTGGTAFRCREVRVTLEEGLMLSAGAVNALRRGGLTALEEAAHGPAGAAARRPGGAGAAAADLLPPEAGAADAGAGGLPPGDDLSAGGVAGYAGCDPVSGPDVLLRCAAPHFPDGGRGGAAGDAGAAPAGAGRRGRWQSGSSAHCRGAGTAAAGRSGDERIQLPCAAVFAGAGALHRRRIL